MSLAAQPVIHSITLLPAEVGHYEKAEVALDLTAAYTNPYDYDQIQVAAIFTGPDGRQIPVDGFYIEDYTLSHSGSLTPAGQGFRVRFSPHLTGTWTCQIRVTDAAGTTHAPAQTFVCVPATNPHNTGFARTSASHYLRTDKGEQLILVGENMCWQNGNIYQDYTRWLGKLIASGGNYFRLWHAHWGLGIEWKNNVSQYQGLRRYQQAKARYQDWLYDYCTENGVYVMLALQHHGPVSTQVNPNWNESPYNAANGGPCAHTWDFFTDSTARAHTRNRFRYIVARWGYSRAILAWELFNEVEWTDNYAQRRGDVANWHAEMAAYLKSIDPYQHLVTTSFADETNDPLVWTTSDIDLTQTHYYVNTPNLERVLAGGIRRYLLEYSKPTLTGEFGIGASSTLPQLDPDGIHIHNSLWGALFAGGLGAGMTWWWDSYIEVQDLYHHFEGVTAVAAQVPFVRADMKPASATVTGVPGALSLTPGLGWGVMGTDSLVIGADGQISPATYGLGSYLYGSQWNTQFRSPPVFEVTYPSAGTFTVRTGSTAGTAPRITLYLDGVLVLNQAASPHTSYSISLPAGTHQIKVDNTGTDWITIASYEFSGLGSLLDAYVLQGTAQPLAAGWLLSHRYNHEVVPQGLPAPVSGAQLHLTGLADTSYFLKWYDCLTGALLSSTPVMVTGGQVSLPVPPILWDMAFVLDQTPGTVTSQDTRLVLDFSLFPNPATSGAPVTLHQSDGRLPARVSLLDVQGRQVGFWQVSPGSELRLPLPPALSEGLYWVKVVAGEKAGARPLVIHRSR